MKFITTLKILITIFALIQFCFSTNTESRLRSSTGVSASSNTSASAKGGSKLSLKSKANLAAKIKATATVQAKAEANSELKNNYLNFYSFFNTEPAKANVIDPNNLFNAKFDQPSKDNTKKEDTKKEAAGATAGTGAAPEAAADAKNNSKENAPNAGANANPVKAADGAAASGQGSNASKTIAKTPNHFLADWLMISSEAFKDKNKFPDIFISQTGQYIRINTDSMNFRINDAHKKDQQEENLPREPNCFWFRLSGLNIYYSSTVSDLNILGSISISTVVGLINLENDHSGYFCFIIKDNSGIEWKICSQKVEKRNTWVCAIQSTLGVPKESFCNPNGAGAAGSDGNSAAKGANVIEKNVNLIKKIYFNLYLQHN